MLGVLYRDLGHISFCRAFFFVWGFIPAALSARARVSIWIPVCCVSPSQPHIDRVVRCEQETWMWIMADDGETNASTRWVVFLIVMCFFHCPCAILVQVNIKAGR
jgi:hypothetical protein